MSLTVQYQDVCRNRSTQASVQARELWMSGWQEWSTTRTADLPSTAHPNQCRATLKGKRDEKARPLISEVAGDRRGGLGSRAGQQQAAPGLRVSPPRSADSPPRIDRWRTLWPAQYHFTWG
ncbi:hypothetical protein AAFF_G00337390 [Aldrovandia affinis]|uniref:Uncharacterized protein n=1 Tax=Aldrovandia affinis TaxID=143900 RepID=A0AAD7WPG1_9TELE|nr:hypothetical protein AAFF_G00337390 [Aldrovandia affinis]